MRALQEDAHVDSRAWTLLEQTLAHAEAQVGMSAQMWRNNAEILRGALLSRKAPASGAAGWDDAKLNEALQQARALPRDQAAERFAPIGALILAGAGSDFIDMDPPNDGGDLISSWLSGVMMLRRASEG